MLLIAYPVISAGQDFVHPGGLVTKDDIARIRYLLSIDDPTIKAAFEKLKSNNHASYNTVPRATEVINRGGATGENYGVAMNQAASAFQNALMWRITEDTRYGDCAVRILNTWARTCKEVVGNTNYALAAGIYGYEFAQAGELLRGYDGWSEVDFKTYQKWVRDVFYPSSTNFLITRHGTLPGHYWANWGLCNTLCIISIGILCDDVAIYNEGLSYYKDDKLGTFTDEPRDLVRSLGYNEFLGNNVVWMHPDERGPFGYLGQMQECGRDQGHTTMEAGLSVDICQTVWNQGEDLYAYMDNRLAAGLEYVALINSLETDEQVADSVPFKRYEKLGAEAAIQTKVSVGGRGAARPYWDRVIAHYEGEKGIPMRYSRKMKEKAGIDGGGGHYGGNSGGFDHLGFSTLINYHPESMYPRLGNYPVSLRAQISYAGKTLNDNRVNEVEKGSTITLIPSLPEEVTEDGTWKWETGETTRELTFTVQRSGIYRVTYTSASGVKSTQTFNIAMWGDCTPTQLLPKITVGQITYQDTIVKVLPYQQFTLALETHLDRGTFKWNTGSTKTSITLNNGIRNDSVFQVEHFNPGGYRSIYNFHVKLTYITPTISINGGTAEVTDRVIVSPGKQTLELIPKTTMGFDNGTFLWSTGHTSKNLVLLDVQHADNYKLYYTLTKNGITTTDTIEFKISVMQENCQLTNGDYYIQNAEDHMYLTNTNVTATTKIKPIFMEKDEENSFSQIWTISKETETAANGRFKIVSKKDGNYVNENGDFGTNPYFPIWNTYTFRCLEREDLFAIQNGGNSGTKFWTIRNGLIIQDNEENTDEFPFLIIPVVPNKEEPNLSENTISYILPAYSVNGTATQRGDEIHTGMGKDLRLRPIVVAGISGGNWLWSDNSTNSYLDLTNLQRGGVFSVKYTYIEKDTVRIFPLTFTVTLSEDNYEMPEGRYRILRASDNSYLTNKGTVIPEFSSISADTLSQQWIVSIDEATSRYKIVSAQDERFLTENGRFSFSSYDSERNSYLFHYENRGDELFSIQNAGKSGSTFWTIIKDAISSNNQTVRDYSFKFEFIDDLPTGMKDISLSGLKIYPNPVQDYMIVELDEAESQLLSFTLYNLEGKPLLFIPCTSGINKIDTSTIPGGIYLGVFNFNGERKSFKIIKK